MLGYLSADITCICSEKRTVFREQSSWKTVSYKEQIMSKDKFLSMFSPQMETIVFIILQIFFATGTIFKIGEYSRIFPSFSWGIFGDVTRLDQSRMSEKIWWIIRSTTNFTLSYIVHMKKYMYNVQFQKISILPPQRGLEFPGGWGVLQGQKL